jgi:TonB family protein
MNKREWISVLLTVGLFFSLPRVFAQQAIKVSESEAARHAIEAPPPVYPRILTRVGIQGQVLLQFTIALDGSVTQLQAVSGHPMLLQPALDAVRQWKYSPFLSDGAAVPAQTYVHLLFALGPDADSQQKYFAQEVACRDLLLAQNFVEAGTACNAALASAKQLKSDALRLRVNAFGNAGLAAYHLNHLPEAIEDFEARLKLAKNDLPSEDGEWFDVHHDLALALQASGQTTPADVQYHESEKSLNAASKSLQQSPGPKDLVERLRAEIGATMKATLMEHAALLRQMGRTAEA